MSRRARTQTPDMDRFLKPDSPEYIEGFLFKETIANRSIRSDVFNRQLFATRDNSTRDVFRKNIIGMFRTIEFYIQFVDHPEFTKIVADDLGWGRETVKFMLQIFIWGRENYQMSHMGASQSIPPEASPAARLICAFVDDYCKLTEPDGPRTFTWTPNRVEYVRTTREAWKKHLIDNPLALLDACPHRPPRPQANDWVEAPRGTGRRNRRRSRSPAARGARRASGRELYRDRSSYGDSFRHDSPQLKYEDDTKTTPATYQAPAANLSARHASIPALFPQRASAPSIFAPNASLFSPNASQPAICAPNTFPASSRPAPGQTSQPFSAQAFATSGRRFSDIIGRALTDARAFATQGSFSAAATEEINTTIKHLEVLSTYAVKSDGVIHGEEEQGMN